MSPLVCQSLFQRLRLREGVPSEAFGEHQFKAASSQDIHRDRVTNVWPDRLSETQTDKLIEGSDCSVQTVL